MKNILFIAIPFLALLFAGCQKELEFDGDTTESQVVLVSQPEADSLWTLRLTWSRFFLSEKPIATIDDATVLLTVNGRSAGTAQPLGDGMYDTRLRPVPGDSLSLQVQVPGRPAVTAACRIPQRPSVSHVATAGDTSVYSYTDYIDGRDTTLYDTTFNPVILLTLDDPADEENYYCVEVQRSIYNYATEEDEWEKIYIEVDDNVLFDVDVQNELFGEGEVENYGQRIFFSDERINGISHTLRISYWQYDTHRCKLVLRAISKDLYLYLRSLKSQRNSSDFGFLSEPVQIICNVQEGIGVLGGSASYVLDL